MPRPDLITLDVVRPDRDAWSVLSALRSDASLAYVPVILITIERHEFLEEVRRLVDAKRSAGAGNETQ